MARGNLLGRCRRGAGVLFALVLLSILASACNPGPRAPGQPPALGSPVPDAGVVWLNSLAEAQQKASFPLLVPDPQTLPGGLTLSGIGYLPPNQHGQEMVSLSYRSPSDMDLDIQEVKLPHPLVAAPQPHQTLTVRGRPAYLTTAGGAAGVAWEEDHLGIMMSVDASLSEARLLDIAEHLRPFGQK